MSKESSAHTWSLYALTSWPRVTSNENSCLDPDGKVLTTLLTAEFAPFEKLYLTVIVSPTSMSFTDPVILTLAPGT